MPFSVNYRRKLSGQDLARYERKMMLCGGIDPFELDPGTDVTIIPDVHREDLVGYLVHSSDFFTLKQLKSYKALEAHNFLTSGHVKMVTSVEIAPSKLLAFGKVVHSQSISATPLLCWILANKDGDIETAHCTCMAGVGSACSHIGAVLFYLELEANRRRETTCTSKENGWLPPAGRLGKMQKIMQSDFRSAGRKWKELATATPAPAEKVRRFHESVRAPTDEQIRDALSLIRDKEIPCALLRVTHFQQPAEESPERTSLPAPIDVFNRGCGTLSYEELLQHCQEVFQSISITNQEAEVLERATRGQQANPLWKKYRAGRITASVMKSVCRTSLSSPAVSTLKQICYPQESFSTEHTRRGIREEPAILQEFAQRMSGEHKDFRIENCGFIVNPKYPYLGASPDSITHCSCHGLGVVECKSIAVDKKENTGLLNGVLDQNHKFMYQIQTQMLVCNVVRAHFVEKTPSGDIFVQLIENSDELRKEIIGKALAFYLKAVLPELVCRHFTAESHILSNNSVLVNSYSQARICLCQEPPAGAMINCINPGCQIITFHKKCVGITKRLKRWYCVSCASQRKCARKP